MTINKRKYLKPLAIKLTRKELDDLVWEESLLAISKRIKILGAELGKSCVVANIPLPTNGYWSVNRHQKVYQF